ncbi:MAG: type II toxin-antitoxin system YafQ family toxin [Treponema sp.]|nr:type II toxin-antitoxin system YafQ family toxin [Treponema sp.]MCL2237782.1 type II toxin-antitoxin system YafQ family toxin [Treponema sp.]
MLDAIFTGPFKKDRKLMVKQNKDMTKLDEVMDLLINEKPLLPKHKNHLLYGDYKGKMECHVELDWLLIYCIEKSTNEILFNRTGSHSELF